MTPVARHLSRALAYASATWRAPRGRHAPPPMHYAAPPPLGCGLPRARCLPVPAGPGLDDRFLDGVFVRDSVSELDTQRALQNMLRQRAGVDFCGDAHGGMLYHLLRCEICARRRRQYHNAEVFCKVAKVLGGGVDEKWETLATQAFSYLPRQVFNLLFSTLMEALCSGTLERAAVTQSLDLLESVYRADMHSVSARAALTLYDDLNVVLRLTAVLPARR